MAQLKFLLLLLLLLLFSLLLYYLFLHSFPPFVFLFWKFVSVVFVQTLYFYSLPGNNMYVPGDCNILLIYVCDLQCYRKKTNAFFDYEIPPYMITKGK